MFSWTFKLIFLILYFGSCYLITIFLYNHSEKYYRPIYITKPDGSKINIHEELEVFSRKDKPENFWWFYIRVIFLFWIRFLGSLFCISSLCVILLYYLAHLKTKGVVSKEERPKFKKQIMFWTKSFLY